MEPFFGFWVCDQICTFFWSTILWDSRAKRVFPASDNIFHVYLVRGLQKYAIFFKVVFMCHSGQMLRYLILYPKNIFRFIRPVHVISKWMIWKVFLPRQFSHQNWEGFFLQQISAKIEIYVNFLHCNMNNPDAFLNQRCLYQRKEVV